MEPALREHRKQRVRALLSCFNMKSGSAESASRLLSAQPEFKLLDGDLACEKPSCNQTRDM
jgi:hypothetical protein